MFQDQVAEETVGTSDRKSKRILVQGVKRGIISAPHLMSLEQ
jgi:hypothetical protein